MTLPKVLAFATLGSGSHEETRIRDLLRDFNPIVVPFDRNSKFGMLAHLLRTIRRERPDIIVMEGTGVAGGMALILARLLLSQKYIVSSGDAIGPWVGSHLFILGPMFGLYERILYRFASGFIGWTPYLVGRALTFGCRRGVTAPGWSPFQCTKEEILHARLTMRARLGIPPANYVVGIAGSMIWNSRYQYCYGLELIESARLIERTDVTFLLVGDGNGQSRLENRASELPAGRVIFTGRVPRPELPGYYAAMDIGCLPQSVDDVGGFRYTTKVSEYLSLGLPIITTQIPMAYDLDEGGLWRLPGDAPWDKIYIQALASMLNGLTLSELSTKRQSIPKYATSFNYEPQARRVKAFLCDLHAIH